MLVLVLVFLFLLFWVFFLFLTPQINQINSYSNSQSTIAISHLELQRLATQQPTTTTTTSEDSFIGFSCGHHYSPAQFAEITKFFSLFLFSSLYFFFCCLLFLVFFFRKFQVCLSNQQKSKNVHLEVLFFFIQSKLSSIFLIFFSIFCSLRKNSLQMNLNDNIFLTLLAPAA